MSEHAHETSLYRRARVGDAERLIETCDCGAVRHTDRAPTRVVFEPWFVGIDVLRIRADAAAEGMDAGDDGR